MENKPEPTKTINPYRWLALICGFQLIFWTVVPWLVRNTLHSDTLEGIAWGNLWQWGYDKHPPLAAWASAVFANMSDSVDFPVYLFAQLCIVLTFIGVWKLAREYLNDYGALLAVFLLQGILFYSNRVERVTPDTLQHPIWAWMALAFYWAVTRESLKYWLLTGALAGLAVLTKYQAAILFIPLLLLLLFTVEGRKNLGSSGPWLGGIIATIILTPHIIWLYEHNFAAIGYLEDNYVESTRYGSNTLIDHLIFPWRFITSNFGNVFLLFLLMIPLFRASKQKESESNQTAFKKWFLLAIATGPFLFTLLFGLITGEKLVPRWATPYFAWLPLLLIVWLKPVINFRRFKTVVSWSLFIGFLLLSLRGGYLYFKPQIDDKYWRSVEFQPLKSQMQKAEQLWNNYYNYPMPYFGGMHYDVAEMGVYSKDKPVPFMGLTEAESLWMRDDDFRKGGGIIVLIDGKRESENVRRRMNENFPKAEFLETVIFKPIPKIEIDNKPDLPVHYYLLRPEQ